MKEPSFRKVSLEKWKLAGFHQDIDNVYVRGLQNLLFSHFSTLELTIQLVVDLNTVCILQTIIAIMQGSDWVETGKLCGETRHLSLGPI